MRSCLMLNKYHQSSLYLNYIIHLMTQLTPIKGFTNTPVTKSICILSTVLTLALLILSLKPYVMLSIDPFIVEYFQYWRVATFQLSVVNESDFLLITVLWFQYKNLERFFGPKKYLSVIALFALYNAVITFLVLSLGQLAIVGSWATLRYIVMHQEPGTNYFRTIFNSATPGPLGIISLLYVCYARYVPVTYLFKLLLRKPKDEDLSEVSNNSAGSNLDDQAGAGAGENTGGLVFDITLTSHFQIQVLYTILLFNHGFSSFIPCLVGLLIGKLYTLDLLIGSKSWVLPTFVFQLFVSPQKARVSAASSITSRFRGYQPVSGNGSALPQVVIHESTPIEEADEDREMAIDDLRNQDEDAAARSATPVRPLGQRFLDTFRA